MIELNDNVVEDGLDELLSQFANAENLKKLLSIGLEQLREAESMVYDLFWLRTLEGARGKQLDIYGKIVDEPRDGLDDSDYRRFLNMRLLVLYARGDAERLRRIVALASGSDDVRYTNEPPASYGLTYAVAAPLTEAARSRILRAVEAATPSGVGFRVSEASADGYFGFDEDEDALGFDEGELAEELE